MAFWSDSREIEVYNTGSIMLYKIGDTFYTVSRVENSNSDFSEEVTLTTEKINELAIQCYEEDTIEVKAKLVYEDCFYNSICIHYTAIFETIGYTTSDSPTSISINGIEHSLQFYAPAKFLTCNYPKMIFTKK